MARRQEIARPFYQVCHEYDASLKALLNAGSMLHSAVSTAVSLAKSPEQAMRLIATLKEYDDAYKIAAHGKDDI